MSVFCDPTVSLQVAEIASRTLNDTSFRSLCLAEVPAAIEVLRMALHYIADQKEEAVVV